MKKIFRIGFLQSKEASWQKEQITSLIVPSGYQIEEVSFKGSEHLNKSLLDGSIDLVIIQATKLALEFPEEFELIALTERLQVNDVVLGVNTTASLADYKIRVGVTSEIKLAFLKRYYTKAIATLEDNAETCIEKINKGSLDLAILAYEEALPFGFDKFIQERIETSYFVPSAGQGSLAVLCHKKLPFGHKEVLQRWVNHEETEDCFRSERSFLKTIDTSDNMLAFSYAHFEGALITLKAGLISSDGKSIFKIKKSAALGESRELGKKVALDVAHSIDESRVHTI